MIISLTHRTQDFVKIDNASFELEDIFKCDGNIFSATLPIHKYFSGPQGLTAWDKKTTTQNITYV